MRTTAPKARASKMLNLVNYRLKVTLFVSLPLAMSYPAPTSESLMINPSLLFWSISLGMTGDS